MSLLYPATLRTGLVFSRSTGYHRHGPPEDSGPNLVDRKAGHEANPMMLPSVDSLCVICNATRWLNEKKKGQPAEEHFSLARDDIPVARHLLHFG